MQRRGKEDRVENGICVEGRIEGDEDVKNEDISL